MKRIFVSCPPMLGERSQIEQLATQWGLEIVCADVVQTLSKEELIAQLPNFDAWIAGDDQADAEVIQHAYNGKLRGLVKWGIGIDNIDTNTVEKLSIKFANTPGMFSNEVADIALGYLISLVRKIPNIDKNVRANNWIKPQGESLSGKTAGIIGLGNIGQALARRLHACELKLVGYDPYADNLDHGQIQPWPVHVGELDYLFLCCALTPENRHIINADILSQMKTSAYLINVSRGPLVDEAALVEALQNDQLRGAALDVFETEPLPQISPLITMENTILGSHNASNTKEAVQATNARAVELAAGMIA